MPEEKQLAKSSNGLFLVGGGIIVLALRALVLNRVSRAVISLAAIGWGGYLILNKKDKTQGIASMAAGGAVFLFGGLVGVLGSLAGIGMIIGGVVSLISGLFKKNQ